MRTLLLAVLSIFVLPVHGQADSDDMLTRTLEAVVVSSNRNETTRRMAPTLVSVIGENLFATTNSATL